MSNRILEVTFVASFILWSGEIYAASSMRESTPDRETTDQVSEEVENSFYRSSLDKARIKDKRLPANIPVETRAYFSKNCILTDDKQSGSKALLELALSAIVPKLIEWVIDSSVDSLTKIEKRESASTFYEGLYQYGGSVVSDEINDDGKYDKISISSALPFWRPELSCFTIVTGKQLNSTDGEAGLKNITSHNSETVNFSISSDDIPSDKRKRKRFYQDKHNEFDLKILNRLAENNIIIDEGGLYSIYEAKLEMEADKSAFRIKSKLIKINKLLAGWSSGTQLYKFQIAGPGITADSNIYLSSTIDLGEVKPPFAAVGTNIKKGAQSGLLIKPGMTKASYLQFLVSRKAGVYTPAKISFANIQTKEPSGAAKLLAKALTTVKPAILSAVGESLEAKDEDKEKAEYQAAEIKYEKAKLAYALETDAAKKAIAKLEEVQACDAFKLLGGAVSCV